MDQKIKDKIAFWKQHGDEKTVEQINNMNAKELALSFTGSLTFGTAGMRGMMDPGPNSINKYTITRATYGYAKYLQAKYPNQQLKVVIGTDNRHFKELFAQTTARILSSMNIQVYMALVIPTPFVSYAIRHLGADGGIIITASHNPPTHNGFKVYDNTGGQLLPKDASLVEKLAAQDYDQYLTFKYQAKLKLIHPIPAQVFRSYENKILKLHHDRLKPRIKIVFSPQHGTSAQFIPAYLKKLKYQVIEVKEQMSHDPDFSNTLSPNPEDPQAYQLAIEYAQKTAADLIITTDPDADRIGVAALKNGKYEILSGNELATIVFKFLLETETLPPNPLLVYSYVSSDLLALMAKAAKIKTIKVATGFKWVSHIINKYQNKYNFIFGFEESYGLLINDEIARDKDAMQAAVVVAKIANHCAYNNKSLWDYLEDTYKKYCYVANQTLNKSFFGLKANQERIAFMDNLRKNQHKLFKEKVKIVDLTNGQEEIAPMNLIKFIFPSGSWIAIRPSGTEAKIKFYTMAIGKTQELLQQEFKKLQKYQAIIMNGDK